MATVSSRESRRHAAHEPQQLDIGDERWWAFVESRPDALPFHHPAWAELLSAAYGYRPFVLTLVDGAGAVVAGLPVIEARRPFGRSRWISLPFTDACPPLVSSADDEVRLAGALVAASVESGIASVEVRSPLPVTMAQHRSDAVVHTLQLGPDPDVVFKTFHRSQVQRNVRRARREKVVVRRAQSKSDLTRTFYGLHLQTRRRLGVPVQPRLFFDELWARLIEPGVGRLHLVYSGTTPVAGAVFLAWKQSVTYKYGASDSAHWSLRPNHLLFWRAIEEACRSGYRWFDFGRSEVADVGLREFKSGWGTREEALVYATIGDRTADRGGRGTGLRITRGLLRRSPAWVCRVTGELLYRYAA